MMAMFSEVWCPAYKLNIEGCLLTHEFDSEMRKSESLKLASVRLS
jgi:hypothetical protein